MKWLPGIGSPPMPTQLLWPNPRSVVCFTASYVNVPERETMPTLPGRWMSPGMMPILHSPGVMTPGQFGPIKREPSIDRRALIASMSSVGIPSVMQTINFNPAAAASRMESLQTGAGT